MTMTGHVASTGSVTSRWASCRVCALVQATANSFSRDQHAGALANETLSLIGSNSSSTSCNSKRSHFVLGRWERDFSQEERLVRVWACS